MELAAASRPPTLATTALGKVSPDSLEAASRLLCRVPRASGIGEGDTRVVRSLPSCQQPLPSAKVRAPVLPGPFSLAPPPFPSALYLFKLHLSLTHPHSTLASLHLFSPFSTVALPRNDSHPGTLREVGDRLRKDALGGSVCIKHEFRWSHFLLAAKHAHKSKPRERICWVPCRRQKPTSRGKSAQVPAPAIRQSHHVPNSQSPATLFQCGIWGPPSHAGQTLGVLAQAPRLQLAVAFHLRDFGPRRAWRTPREDVRPAYPEPANPGRPCK